jgi:predicted RNase H-like HicB family nuclease
MRELQFKVYQEEEGGYVAKAKFESGSIITEGDDLKELKEMIKDAVKDYFFDKPSEIPQSIRLHFVRINEEVFAIAS